MPNTAEENNKPKSNKKYRYLLICSKRGVFLGLDTIYAYFAGLNTHKLSSAPTFETAEYALELGEKYLSIDSEDQMYFTLPVELPPKVAKASVIDIIKAGGGAYIGDMIKNIPDISKTVH